MCVYNVIIFIFLFFVVTNVNAGRRFICIAHFMCEPLCPPHMKGKCINYTCTCQTYDGVLLSLFSESEKQLIEKDELVNLISQKRLRKMMD
ncbi:hypothetical protein P8452_01365 [Trifolium repens]|nr:hypothetical protein P8452_01365 [Trifolium repens]